MTTVLGSSSPRRRELFSLLTDSYSVISPNIDETPLHGESPYGFCERIAREKAESLYDRLEPDTLLVCADTIVTVDDIILGKPLNREDAVGTLTRLSGRPHRVITSVFAAYFPDNRPPCTKSAAETTEVIFRPLSSRIIEAYLYTTDYSDKAGSYAIQENGEMLIESVTGSASNVMGFPMNRFIQILRDMDLFLLFFNFR